MEVTLDHIEIVAPNIRTFWFRSAKLVQYVAGQYTQLYLPHDDIDERGDRRWFTLSSSPTEPFLAVTTKFANSDGSSFKRALANLQPGTKVHLADPMGDFVLPKDSSIPLVFAGAGAGITPIRSIVKYLLDSGEKRDIQLLHAAGSESELAFAKLFDSYTPLRYSPIIAHPTVSGFGESERGRLTAERILQTVTDTPHSLIYLSGPESLVEKLDRDLKAAGITPERLVTDFFHGYTDV